MKTIIAIIALLTGSAVFACGNFSGDFFCIDQSDNVAYDLTVEQTGNIFTIIDDDGTTTMYADGQQHALSNGGGIVNAYYIATCNSNTIEMNVTGEMFDDSTGMTFPFTGHSTHEMKTRNNVVQTNTITIFGQSQTSQTICNRK